MKGNPIKRKMKSSFAVLVAILFFSQNIALAQDPISNTALPPENSMPVSQPGEQPAQATDTFMQEGNVPEGWGLGEESPLSASTVEEPEAAPDLLKKQTSYSFLSPSTKLVLAAADADQNEALSVEEIHSAVNDSNLTQARRKDIFTAVNRLFNDPNAPPPPGSEAEKIQARYNVVLAVFQYADFGMATPQIIMEVKNILHTVSPGANEAWDNPAYKDIIRLLANHGDAYLDREDFDTFDEVMNAFFQGTLNDYARLDLNGDGRISLYEEALPVLRDSGLDPQTRSKLALLAVKFLPPDEAVLFQQVMTLGNPVTFIIDDPARYLTAYTKILQLPASEDKEKQKRILYLLRFYNFISPEVESVIKVYEIFDPPAAGEITPDRFRKIVEVLPKLAPYSDDSWKIDGEYVHFDVVRQGAFDKQPFEKFIGFFPDTFPDPLSGSAKNNEPVMINLPAGQDGSPITYSMAGTPGDSQASVETGGMLTVIPSEEASGTMSITVDGLNALGVSFKCKVEIKIDSPAPPPPPAENLPTALPKTGAVTVLANGQPLRFILPEGNYRIFEKPSHGTLTVDENRQVLYVPDSGYDGPDSFSFAAISPLLEGKISKIEKRMDALDSEHERSLEKIKDLTDLSENLSIQNKLRYQDIEDLEDEAEALSGKVRAIDLKIGELSKKKKLSESDKKEMKQLEKDKNSLEKEGKLILEKKAKALRKIDLNNREIKEISLRISALKHKDGLIEIRKEKLRQRILRLLAKAPRVSVGIKAA